MADNCVSMDWFSYRPSSLLPDKLWMTEAIFARQDDDDALITRALQASLSQQSSPPNSSSNHFFQQQESETNNNEFAVESKRIRNPTRMTSSSSVAAVSGKIGKRKSRASKKSATTYITADPANFRQMVQQVTGGASFGGGGCGFLPVETETHVGNERNGFGFGGGMVLPTLDTSSSLLVQETLSFPTDTQMGSGGGYVSTTPVGLGSGSAFGNFYGFPTLESWGAM